MLCARVAAIFGVAAKIQNSGVMCRTSLRQLLPSRFGLFTWCLIEIIVYTEANDVKSLLRKIFLRASWADENNDRRAQGNSLLEAVNELLRKYVCPISQPGESSILFQPGVGDKDFSQ